MSETRPVIAIDGPAASGKGTLARQLADALDFAHLDTGALYRGVGAAALKAGTDPADPAGAARAAQIFRAGFHPSMLEDPALRTGEAGQAASKVAAVPEVRAALFALQQDFAVRPPDGKKGAVLDGRDIGTVICPDAPLKLFVTASVEIRARRRFDELRSRGLEQPYETVLEDMRARDARDSGRDAAPLKPAADAVLLDTSAMSAADVFETALRLARERLPR